MLSGTHLRAQLAAQGRARDADQHLAVAVVRHAEVVQERQGAVARKVEAVGKRARVQALLQVALGLLQQLAAQQHDGRGAVTLSRRGSSKVGA